MKIFKMKKNFFFKKSKAKNQFGKGNQTEREREISSHTFYIWFGEKDGSLIEIT